MARTQANGITLDFDLTGPADKPVLVLISGLGYDRWQWNRMAHGLAGHFRVLTFDNRGAGASDKPIGPYTAGMLARDTADLMTALGIERAHVVGHSMGGFVAQALALDHAERVSGLVLASTNFGGPRAVPVTPEALAVLTDTAADPIERLKRGVAVSTAPGFVEVHPEFVQEWLAYRAAHPIDPVGYAAQMGIGLALMAESACFEPRLPSIIAPTLVLFGAHDKVVPPANAGLIAQRIAGSRAVILPDAGHFFPFETPQEANRVIIEFLQSI